MELITTCSSCGSRYRWDDIFWPTGMPDCPVCSFNNSTGQKGMQEGPMERAYRQNARDLMQQHGTLKRVEYLSHFPKFEINFIFERKTIYSGKRRRQYDINFMSLGYFGEGPRYARHFLDEANFSMTEEEIAAIRPGAKMELREGKVFVFYSGEAAEVNEQRTESVENLMEPGEGNRKILNELTPNWEALTDDELFGTAKDICILNYKSLSRNELIRAITTHSSPEKGQDVPSKSMNKKWWQFWK